MRDREEVIFPVPLSLLAPESENPVLRIHRVPSNAINLTDCA